MNDFAYSADGRFITASGLLDAAAAQQLVVAMPEDIIYTLDFDGVTEVKFAAMRCLLNCRKSGKRFCIINANDSVAERFEDSGVSVFINICRKPKHLDIGKYTEFGASFLSHAFDSEDGDSMIKVYGKRVPKWLVAQEKTVARAVMVFGINTPLVGTLYDDGESTGLDFERIEGKKSFSRIISEDPDRLEEMSRRFARMCKELHSTPCDTNIFSDRTMFYRQAVMNCTQIDSDLKSRLMDFVDSIPSATTCLHGDMQISNVITTEKEDMWIDLSDFGYGYYMLDMGMWYFLSVLNEEFRVRDLFHLGKAEMKRIWEYFIDEYFDAKTQQAREKVTEEVSRYAALHSIYLGTTYGFEPGLIEYVQSVFK